MKNTAVYANRVALITGGASGIGAALARQLAACGAKVVLADRQRQLAENVGASIRASGGTAEARELDVRDASAVIQVVGDVAARWGGVHYFFNNAGVIGAGEVEDYLPADWDHVIDVNVRGVAYGIQAVYPMMIRQGEGHIINTASIAGLLATPGQVAYSASKHAVVGLSKALRLEAKQHNVRVSVLCPGVIRTPILTGGEYGHNRVEGLTDEVSLRVWEQFRPMDVDVFAAKAVAAVARNEAIIVIPGWWKLLWAIDRLSPALSMRLSRAGLEKARAMFEAAGVRRPQRQAGEVAKQEAADGNTI